MTATYIACIRKAKFNNYYHDKAKRYTRYQDEQHSVQDSLSPEDLATRI